MRKKGDFWDLKTIILLLVVFVVLFYITKGVISLFTKSGSSQACLLSVIATSKMRGTDALSLECYTNFVGDIKSKKGNDDVRRDYIMGEISSLMYECWQQFGEGEYDVFPGEMDDEAAHCFICSKFNLDKDKAGITIKPEDFLRFIKEHHIGRSKTSYYDFLDDGFLIEEGGLKPIIFVEKMDIEESISKKIKDITDDVKNKLAEYYHKIVGSSDDAPSLEEVRDGFTKSIDIEELGEGIKYDENGYAVIYYQVSKHYWQQVWITKFVAGLVNKVSEKLFDKTLYEKSVPPAYILITKYPNVKELNCDVLQG